jgi:TolB-like protein
LSSTGRRLFCAIAAVACVALMGAARPSRPAPTPVPTAIPTPAPLVPVLVVYPFEVQGGLQAATGTQVAQIITQQIQSQPKIQADPVPVAVPRTDYLINARELNADYYVSGYLTPMGDGASLLLQLVSVQTGIQVWSHTAIIQNTDDAQAQGDLTRQAVLVISGVDQTSVDQSDSAQATPTPSADNGSSFNLGGLKNLFGLLKHGKAAPNVSYAPPAQVADANKPARVIIAMRVSGSGIPGDVLTSATQTMVRSLSRAYRVRNSDLAVTDVASSTNAICGSHRDATIAAGSLAQTHDRGRTVSTFSLDIYACFGASIFHVDKTADSLQDAINAAAAAYASAHASNS